MFFLAISTIVNYVITVVGLFYPYVFTVVHWFPHADINIFFALCLILQLMLLTLGMTRYGFWILVFYQGYRLPIQRENEQIQPLAEAVVARHNQVYKTNYKYSGFKFYVAESQELNAYAFSKHCIILTTGLLKLAANAEIMAVLAHEIGHLYYRDCQILMGGLWIEFPTRIFMRIYGWLYMLACRLGQQFKDSDIVNIVLGFLVMPLLLILLPFWLLALLNNRIFNLANQLSAKATEYRADYHAFKLGYAPGMLSFLEKIELAHQPSGTLFAELTASHPSPRKRIGRLDDYISGKVVADYDIKAPRDKFLPTLMLVAIACGGVLLWGHAPKDKLHSKKHNSQKAGVAAVKHKARNY